MDEWRNRVTGQLLGTSPPQSGRFHPVGVTALEMALGRGRCEIAYLLEFGKAHELPVSGTSTGDDVWIRIGGTTLRFNYSRRAGVIVASVVGRDDAQIKWSQEQNALIGPNGERLDLESYVRDAVETTVNHWRASVKHDARTSGEERPPQPTLVDELEGPPSKQSATANGKAHKG